MTGTNPAYVHDQIARIESGEQKPFSICQELAERVADLMENGSPNAGACLQFVADTYDQTRCHPLRLAIENCFLFHLGNRIFSSSDHHRLLGLLPGNLHDALMRQMLATGP